MSAHVHKVESKIEICSTIFSMVFGGKAGFFISVSYWAGRNGSLFPTCQTTVTWRPNFEVFLPKTGSKYHKNTVYCMMCPCACV